MWFGEPAAAWKRAILAARNCGLLLSIGTSGVVFPAAEISMMALLAGAYVVHINAEQVAEPSSRELCSVGQAAEHVPSLVSLMPPIDSKADCRTVARTSLPASSQLCGSLPLTEGPTNIDGFDSEEIKRKKANEVGHAKKLKAQRVRHVGHIPKSHGQAKRQK
ncbi:hypothetical protein E3Z29_01255 [Pseudomonas sp. S150]|nr:hypothetical protein E3Z29_01255 [Pseudomonas sp. S150]